MNMKRIGRISAAATVVSALLTLAACSADRRSEAIRSANSSYNTGNYAEAYRQALTVADAPADPESERQQAAYVAGLAAYRLHNLDDAQRWLTYAASSNDKGLRADAKATLGLVYVEQGRFGLAGDALSQAADLMTGQNRANAFYYAGIAQQKQGHWATARTSLSQAISNSQDAAFRKKVADQLRVTGYTLQVGAFDVESNAKTAAEALAPKAQGIKLGTPRIVAVNDPATSHKRFLVWVGQFSSWPTALMAREQLGQTKAVVTPLSE
jgi:tetratricopeptide (TPR) repeat protein